MAPPRPNSDASPKLWAQAPWPDLPDPIHSSPDPEREAVREAEHRAKAEAEAEAARVSGIEDHMYFDTLA